MKRIFPFLIMLLLFIACNNKKTEVEDTTEYTELANYNGGVITSKMWSVIDGKKVYSFNVRMPGKTVSELVQTSKDLFDMFDMNDTIRIGGFEEVQQSISSKNFDTAYDEIRDLQKEKEKLLNDNYNVKSDGLSYNAVILIGNTPYMITMKEIK